MKPKTEEKAHRLLLAAFLRSDMTIPEMRDLTDELKKNPHFLVRFSDLLSEILDRLTRDRSTKISGTPYEPKDLVEAANYIINRRRMPKSEVILAMENAYPEFARQAFTRDMPMRSILVSFFEIAPVDAANRFMSSLSGSIRDDEYLRGITKRR